MNRFEHLQTIAMEECAALQQAVSKAKRFGLSDRGEPDGPTNAQQIQTEFNDLLAVVDMLNAIGMDLHRDPKLVREKIHRVEKYLLYSKERGTLTD